MSDPIISSLKIASSGLEAQSKRLRVVSENIANAESTGKTAGADPYQRKTVTFSQELDAVTGTSLVKIDRVGNDTTPYPVELDPGNPAANADGYVKMPNVNMLVEMADMREANRSYEANLQVIKQARQLINMTIDLLRS
ncbi:flagellar basal body rod protein FlgC [Consotaella salsifontis]|uniref:Flagellar basal-body rod protein FlgC n=1 Tax=Consotaella salsifontis TaxID=1365950 RepID=A0A1T4NSH1_9HYPH|nr:flagellar basal body rod protein FlgC [Consotaella salsifontis]SJZ81648.1 flagellar basal-body rod protein FlgC [Consotaella salsifontis]